MARYDDEEFIKALNLDPSQWKVVGVPTPKPNEVTGQVPSQRSQTTFTIALAGPGGATRIVTMTPQGPGIDASNVRLEQLDWSVTGVSEAIKPPTDTQAETDAAIAKAQADAAAAKALADQRAAELTQLQTDNAQRERNRTSTGYFVTDKERADIEARGAEQKLTQQQIDNQLKIAGDNNAVARASNETAALNAATNAFTAQRNAEAQAAQVEAVRRTGDLDAAKFEREKADRDIANRIAEDNLALNQLQQRQANEIAAGQLGATQQANVLRGQELEQRAAEARQTAETAALGQASQAAAQVYGAERTAQQNAAQTGGNLLQNRAATFQSLSQAPFTQAASLSQGSAGRFGMLGGGLHAVPEGAVANILQGAMGVSGNLYGGPSALSAAAQAIENVRPGAALTPMGQAAAAIISQIQERASQILKGGQVNAPNMAGPAAVQPAAVQPAAAPTAVAAPVTAPAPAQQFFGQDIQELMRQQMQQHLQPQMVQPAALTAPTTQPTINFNF